MLYLYVLFICCILTSTVTITYVNIFLTTDFIVFDVQLTVHRDKF